MLNRSRSWFLLALPFALVACGGGDPQPAAAGGAPPAQKPVSAVSLKQAEEKYQSLCSTCHGASGKGDGPAAANLDPKPRSFADVAWQGSVTDDHIKKVITFGGAAVGKSPVMPPSPDLKSQPEVLDALVGMVRSFKGK